MQRYLRFVNGEYSNSRTGGPPNRLCMCVYVCVRMHVLVFVCMHMCECLSSCTLVGVLRCVCVWICVCVSVHVGTWMCMQI